MILFILPYCKKAVRPNILLITIDTLRRDHLGCYGYLPDTTPFIDRLAAEGLVFKNVITPMPLTDPGHASILTSLHPLTHQLTRNGAELNLQVETIAEVLKKNGYYTIGTIGAKHLSGKYNFSQGFDSFSDDWDPGIKDWKGFVKNFNAKSQRIAKSINQSLIKQVEDYLDKHHEKPLFIWVHYYDPHTPYIDREDIVLNTRKNDVQMRYDKEIRYTNNHIERLYHFLEKKGLTKEMVTCITADHGEQFGDHGFGSQHVDFYSENTFVPLIFHGYKIPKNKTVEKHVSTMDIGITLLKLANLNFREPIDGVPLLKSNGSPAPLPNRDLLVIGNPLNVKSLQLISLPYSFILNVDFFYESRFISRENKVPENRFKPIPDKWVHLYHANKTDYYEIRIAFPYAHIFRKGMNFVGLRFEIEKNNGVSIGFKPSGNKWSRPSRIDKKTKGTLTTYFPITPLDQSLLYVGFKEGAKIANLRYTFLSKKEFSDYSDSMKKIANKRIFNTLQTLRKFKANDELYNLDSDIKMVNNLLEFKKSAVKVAIEGKKKIYEFLGYYLKRMKKIIGERRPERALTDKEKEMLKSLGYL
ncbi:MAG: sulfatase [Candidatus Aminicenantes bacterium]|nr:MAG: sulfatase [Candidatus Aminicenantes bacterium]